MNKAIEYVRSMSDGPISKKWVFFTIACSVVVVLIRLESVIQTRLPVNQTGDFAYFLAAAHSYFLGFGPYGAEYKLLLEQEFPSYFPVAFFYPPQTLATLLPFAAFDAETATEIFFRVNAACLVLGVVLCWLWVPRGAYAFWPVCIGIVFIPLVAGLASPAMSSLLNSNFSNILLVGFALWAHGGSKRMPILQGVGLAILMLKPSLALCFFLITILVPTYRPAVLIAVSLTAGLYLIGSSYTDPFTALLQYLRALSDFGEHPGNAPSNLVGIFAFIDRDLLHPGALLSIAASLVAALVALVLGTENAWKIGLVAVSLTLFLSPVHLYDMVLLVPAIFLSMTRGPTAPRLVLFVGMIAIILGNRLSALGFDAGLQFQTVLLVVVTLATLRLRFD